MKAAIYSRVMEVDQQQYVQLFFDELERQKIQPVIFHQYYEQIRDIVNLPPSTATFSLSEHLTDEIEFIVSLGDM